jgi:hypothetical protein
VPIVPCSHCLFNGASKNYFSLIIACILCLLYVSAILQLVKTYGDPTNRYTLAIGEDGRYIPGIVANAQFIVAQSILDGTISDSTELQTGLNTINQNLLNWVQSFDGVYEPQFVCGGDIMASTSPSSSFSVLLRRFRYLIHGFLSSIFSSNHLQNTQF